MLLVEIDTKLASILSVRYTSHKDELMTVFKLSADLLVPFVQEEREVFSLMKEKATPASLSKVGAL